MMRVAKVWWLGLLGCWLLGPAGGLAFGQVGHQAIDQMNDQAWALARKMPDSAIGLAREANQLAEAAGYDQGRLNANVLLGILNKDRGYFSLAVEHHLTALRIAEERQDHARISVCLNNIGIVYQEQGAYLQALDYFQQSLAMEKQHGVDRMQTSIRLLNIGEAYERLDSLDKASAYYYNSLLIEQELDNPEGILYARLGIGKVDLQRGQYTKALDELGQALALSRQLENHRVTCEALLAIGEVRVAQQELAPAEAHIQEALGLARTWEYSKLEMDAHHHLSLLYRKKGDLNPAMAHMESYYAMREELNSTTVNSRIGELKATYELEKKDREIAQLEREEALRQEQIHFERKVRNYLILSLAVVVGMIIWTVWRIQRRKAPTGT